MVYQRYTKTLNTTSLHFGFKNFFILLSLLLLTSILLACLVLYWSLNKEVRVQFDKANLLHSCVVIRLKQNSPTSLPRDEKCTFWECFNVYRCGRTGHDRISVYVYPIRKYIDSHGVSATSTVISKEYYSMLESVVESKYYTSNPYEACIFLPSIDTLNQMSIRSNLTSMALYSLDHWNNGENHLLFNMVADTATTLPDLNVSKALIAGADFDTYSYRIGYDVSIPIFSPVAHLAASRDEQKRPWFAVSSQLHLDSYFVDELQKLSENGHAADLIMLDACAPHKSYMKRCDIRTRKRYSYPHVLRKGVFCLIFRGEHMGQMVLIEALAAGCIPVVVMDGHVLPFHDVIDWKRAAVFVMEQFTDGLMDVLKNISKDRISEMQKQVAFLYDRYFSSLKAITITTLDIMQDRVYPHYAKTYEDWNRRPDEGLQNPLFLPLTAARAPGFTAAILTYDRVESLFKLVRKLSKVPSMSKIVVIWNNQEKTPPPLSAFPQISKPIKVIRTSANKLSNRFYPYEEIETEAILTIDDDIVMLSSDEVEFGFEVWREFPDRIVGFPSRTHVWDNVSHSWKYESEWTNEISMVLTGAAFHHKYWSYMYTTALPKQVKDWVDEHMNCEDIAMNFLVANITNKPPIKVTPRKKFKCPECVNNEMLSADIGHMIERSQCVDKFAKAFERMPLISVEFRADPVLYKDSFPQKLLRFNDIGSL